MPLLADLIAEAKSKLLNYEANLTKDVVRKAYLDLAALNPDGLRTVQWNGIALKDFADIINNYRADLRPWVMVYPAAVGLMNPWIVVQQIWCRSGSPPSGQQFTVAVDEALTSLFAGYVNLIAT